jgi:hypothetical protein
MLETAVRPLTPRMCGLEVAPMKISQRCTTYLSTAKKLQWIRENLKHHDPHLTRHLYNAVIANSKTVAFAIHMF